MCSAACAAIAHQRVQYRELLMLLINAPGAAVVTTTEVKRDVPGTFKVAESHRVYVTKDGQPIGGIVSVAIMELLEEALSDRQMASIAACPALGRHGE